MPVDSGTKDLVGLELVAHQHICSTCGNSAHKAINCSMLPGTGGYRVTRVTDKELLTQNQHYAMMHSICAMQENQHKSVEEITAEAYAKAGEPLLPGSSPSNGLDNLQGCLGPFGTPATSGFGGGAASGGGLFGAPAPASPSGLLGAVPLLLRLPARLGRRVLLLGAPAVAGGPFGGAAPAAPGAFGGGSQGASGGFGSTAASGAFGSSSPAVSVRLEHPIPLLLVVEHQVQLLEGVHCSFWWSTLALLPQRVEHSVV